MTDSLLSKTWVKVIAALALLTAIILVGTPFLLQELFRDWLLENGGDQVTVEDVDFNPFMGTLQLKGIQIQVNQERTLAYDSASLDLEWLPLLKKRVVVETVTLRGLQMRVDNTDDLLLILGGIRINKGTGETPDAESETAPSEWAASVQTLTLEDIDLTYRDRNIDITTTIDSLQLHDLTQWSPNTPARLEMNGSINNAPLSLNAELLPYAVKPSYKGKIKLDQFGLDVLSAYVKDQFSEFSGQVSVETDFNLEQDGQSLKIQHQGKLSVNQLALTNPGERIEEKGLSWDGNGNTSVNLESSALNTNVKGKLVSEGLNVENTDPPVEASYDELTWNGNIALATGGDELQLEIRADTLVKALDFTAKTRKLRLGSADSFKIAGLVLEGTDKVSIEKANIGGLTIGQQELDAAGDSKPAVARTKMLQIDKIIYADNALSIDTIDQQSIVSRVVRGKDGKLNMVRIIDLINHLSDPVDEDTGKPAEDEPAREPPVADAADKADQTDPLQISIRQIKATGDSKIHFIDQSVDPEFDMVLDFQKAELNDIDTTKPEQPTTLELEAKSGKYTTLTADGMIKPFLETLDIDMKAGLKAMDLPPLTPYTHDSLGLDMKSGTLETDMRLKTEKQTMDGNVVLKLHQFEVESVDVENSLQSQIPLPLNAALDALRDRNNMIRLEIPIKGDPNSPDFNFNDAIHQALAKGVSKGALAYLSYTLQPYGALISIAKYAGEEISRVRLKPAEFNPGESTLDKTDHEYLGKVAKILHDRPKVAVKICGVAVDKDLDFFRKQQSGKKKPANEQKEQKEKKGTSAKTAPPVSSEPTIDEKKYLEELATKRATAVKDYLVEKHKSDASHLVGCQPKLELGNAEQQPRTDLLI